MNRKSGFTLAEIIITLTIIGVVAAMTIPDMVQDIQDKQFRTAWKKTYSNLEQATRLIASANNGTVKGLFSDSFSVKNQYIKYLSYIKQCDNGKTDGCWHKGNTKFEDGTPDTWSDRPSLILNDGTLIYIWDTANVNCTYDARGTPLGEKTCGQMTIDINGFSAPNKAGKDIFHVHIMPYGLKPFGTQGDNAAGACNKGGDGSGYGCAVIYLYQ